MNRSEQYHKLINKIAMLRKQRDSEFLYSDILLFREYQKRLFRWKEVLAHNQVDMFNKSRDFHNLFIDLSPEWIQEIIPLNKVVDDLQTLGFDNISAYYKGYYGFFMCMYINWELFKNSNEIVSYNNLQHPYETVFKILQRGGTIFNAERLFEIDGKPYLKYNKPFSLPSIEDAFLDYIDKNSPDFPNQDEVNSMWQLFLS